MVEDYKVFCSGTRPNEFTVRASSLSHAGWVFTHNPPPGVVIGPNTVQYTARAGHPWFPWEGRIRQRRPTMHCRVQYKADDGEQHVQTIAVQSGSEESAKAFIRQVCKSVTAIEAQHWPFDDDEGVRTPADQVIHDDDWDD